MSRAEELLVREAEEADAPALSDFMRAQRQERCTPEYLRHWYFRGPVKGGALIMGERNGRILGMATMTAHRFERMEASALVAMPQKVLTDASARGQGIFGKLYRASERACLDHGADFFLTVTNAASTPIFLGKFGYRRVDPPRMAVLLPLPGRPGCRVLVHAEAERPDPDRPGIWRMHKDATYDQWRFIDHPLREYICLACERNGRPLGSIFLKRIRKKGVPVMLLLDMVPTALELAPELLRAARRAAWQHRCLALLVLEEEGNRAVIAANGPVLHRSSNFNLLVKGKDEAHTAALASQRFELAFGDLDFF